MPVRFPLVILSAFASLWMCGCSGNVTEGSGEAVPAGQVDVFAARIGPILDSSCGCHTGGAAEGGIALGSYTAAVGQVVKGDAAASPLLVSMGLSDGVNLYYSSGNAAAIRAWIEDGAPRYVAADEVGEAPAEAIVVGARSCTICHAYERSLWLAGAHANAEELGDNYQQVDNGLDSEGYPAFGTYGLGVSDTCTLVCHDPYADGRDLIPTITGNFDRPVVGCEACHGGGSEHFGAGPIPHPQPAAAQCGPCHNAAFPHSAHYPEGDNVFEDYSASPHSRSINSHTYEGEGETDVRGACSKCHTDEGAKKHREVDDGHDALAAALADASPVEDASPIQCRTCHQAHDPGELLEAETTDDASAVVESAEYRTCTNCHQTSDGYHGENSGHSWEGAYPFPVGVGAFDGGSIIYDTHFDAPATTAVIEGYVMDPSNEHVCRDCHNVHAADTTINRQWARSRHGGQIATAKEAAAADEGNDGTAVIIQEGVGVTDEYGPAWSHYPWTDDTRSDCVQCHTATGAAAYLADPANFDVADADTGKTPREALYDADGKFPHIAMDRYEAGIVRGAMTYGYNALQKEFLYCWGCHSDNSGNLRDPGALTIPYPGTAAGYAYPDLGDSNVCVTCHAGRESGEKLALSTGDFTNMSFVNSHYLTAASVLFTATGYRYDADGDADTDDYANVTYFGHDTIGMTAIDEETGEEVEAAPGTGTSGPCVGCHLKTAEGHLFRPVTKDGTGAITAIASTSCVTCHDGGHGPAFVPAGSDAEAVLAAAEFLNEEKEHCHDAIAVLEAQLAASGFPYSGGYPYFAAKNWLTDSDEDGVGDVVGTGPNNMGAAFNFNLLHHEPGGYAHNRFYVKRLIYDSIDWLDNNVLDDSVAATLDALDAATSYKAGAVSYLVTGFSR